jgi:hypothetical protein
MKSLHLFLLLIATWINESSSDTSSLVAEAFLSARNHQPRREALRATKVGIRYLSHNDDTNDDDSSGSSSKNKASKAGDDDIKGSKPIVLVHKKVPPMKTTDDDDNGTFTAPPEVEPPFWKEAVSLLFLLVALVLCIVTAVKVRCHPTGYREIPSTTLVV